MKTLYLKPALRNAVPRDLEHLVNTTRPSNFEAYLCQVTGVLRSDACKNCSQSDRPWKGCVTIDGLFDSSCANCYFSSIDARYSFSTYLTFQARFRIFRSQI
jgi:hypothetical protein